MRFILPDVDATLKFSQELVLKIKNNHSNQIIFFMGELGAGKTTIIRGILRGLGYQGKVKSPTYALVESYVVEDRLIHHFDFYRIHHVAELTQLGLSEYFENKNICLIEWPEHVVQLLPAPDMTVKIIVLDGGGREVEVMNRSRNC